MEKFEFKYYRSAFITKLAIVAVLAGLVSQAINFVYIFTGYATLLGNAIHFIGGYTFIVFWFYVMFGGNAQGIGILHDEYVEIKLIGG